MSQESTDEHKLSGRDGAFAPSPKFIPSPGCPSGLDRARYFEALADLMEILGAPVDLIRMEEAPQSLRERIEVEGEAL